MAVTCNCEVVSANPVLFSLKKVILHYFRLLGCSTLLVVGRQCAGSAGTFEACLNKLLYFYCKHYSAVQVTRPVFCEKLNRYPPGSQHKLIFEKQRRKRSLSRK